MRFFFGGWWALSSWRYCRDRRSQREFQKRVNQQGRPIFDVLIRRPAAPLANGDCPDANSATGKYVLAISFLNAVKNCFAINLEIPDSALPPMLAIMPPTVASHRHVKTVPAPCGCR